MGSLATDQHRGATATLAVIQVRFVGELAIPLALFVGLGLVHLAGRIDAAQPGTYQVGNVTVAVTVSAVRYGTTLSA